MANINILKLTHQIKLIIEKHFVLLIIFKKILKKVNKLKSKIWS